MADEPRGDDEFTEDCDLARLVPGLPLPLLKRCIAYHLRPLVLACVGGLGFLTTLLAVPILMKNAINGLSQGDGRNVITASLWIALLGGLRAAFGALRKYQAALFQARVGAQLRADVHDHLLGLDLIAHGSYGTGQLLARACGDVTLVEGLAAGLAYYGQSLLVGLSGAFILFALQPALASVVVATLVISGIGALRFARPMYPTSRDVQSLAGDYTNFIEQQVKGIRVTKGHGFEGAHRARGGDLVQALREVGVLLGQQRATFVAAFIVVPNTAMLVVILVGGRMGVHGRLSAGDLFAFIQYVGLLVTPVVVCSQLIAQWPLVRAALARISGVLALRSGVMAPSAPAPFPADPPSLTFENVSFSFSAGPPVLADVSLEVPAGTSLALVGGSGSGKSTVLRLAARLVDPSSGRILLGDKVLPELDPQVLRAHTACIFEDARLFSTTLDANVMLGRPGATQQELRDAMQQAACLTFLDDFPEGGNTRVGENGTALSGGQRQRVAIARAVLRGAPVLLLDDMTSALDPATANTIRAALRRHLGGRTTVLIAQDPETAQLADQVALMREGTIVARGTHAELLQSHEYRTALMLDDHQTASR